MPGPVLTLDRALFVGPLAALVVAAPAALRLSAGGTSLPASWLAIAALLCLPMLISIAAGSVAASAFGRLPVDARRSWAAGCALWAALCFPVDARLGSVLQATTHHRPLGGATYAVMALGVAIAAALVAKRAVGMLAGVVRRPGVAVGLGFVVLAALLVKTALGWAGLAEPARACAVDAALALSAIVVGVWLPLPKRAPGALRAGGLVCLAGILALGWLGFASSAASIGAGAPLASAIGESIGILH